MADMSTLKILPFPKLVAHFRSISIDKSLGLAEELVQQRYEQLYI